MAFTRTLFALLSLGLAVPALATPSDRRLAAVDARDARQDTRVAAGISSGRIDAGEAARFDARQARTDSAQARLAADGRFSRRDRARMDYRQDRTSAGIAYAKRRP